MKKLLAKSQNKTRFVINLIVLVCIILLAVSLWLWWTRIVFNPDRTLQGMISNNFQTHSITKSVDQSGNGSGVKQVSYVSFYPPTINSETKTVLSQGQGANAASVTTETIGTPQSDFVRYTKVEGGQNLPGAENLNDLLGVWAKREQNSLSGEQTSFLGESLFSIIPVGYFNPEQKKTLTDMVNQKGVYRYTGVEKKIENSRPVYVYDLVIKPEALVEVLQKAVELSGAGNSEDLDPSQYQGLGDLQIKLTVDVFSRQPLKAEYPTGRVETYSGQNLYRPLNLPTNTIPVEELQKRLQQEQPAA